MWINRRVYEQVLKAERDDSFQAGLNTAARILFDMHHLALTSGDMAHTKCDCFTIMLAMRKKGAIY